MSLSDEKKSDYLESQKNTKIEKILGNNNRISFFKKHCKFCGFSIIIGILFISIWFFVTKNNKQNFVYKTMKVTQGDLTITVTATGTLEPVNLIEVGSEISGTIREVFVDFNDTVKKNQILAKIDTDQLIARVNQAQASLQVAISQVTQAQATLLEYESKYNRAIKLKNSKVYAEEDYEEIKASYERAKADVKSAESKVKQAKAVLAAEKTTLEKANIRSSINGIVLKRDVEPGQTVAASFQTPILFVLAENLTQMELHVDIDEADIGQIKVNQNATFTVDAYPEKSFKAQITDVYYASSTIDGVVTYKTILSVDNSKLHLRPGMTATADIITKEVKNALLIPNAALRFSPPEELKEKKRSFLGSIIPRPPRVEKKQIHTNGNSKYQTVWKKNDGKLEPISVVTGDTDGINTQILKGDIKPDTELVVELESKQ